MSSSEWPKRRVLATMIVAVATLGYKTGQELDYFPKDVIVFPFLVLALWLLILSWILSSEWFLKFYRHAFPGKRGLMVSIVIGAVIGAITGAAWWKLVEVHKGKMEELESKYAEQKVVEKSESAEEALAREGTARSPNFDVKIFASHGATPYKPPLKHYTLGIQNMNKDSVPVLDLRMEFYFRNVITKVNPQVLLAGGGLTIGAMKVYEEGRSTYTYEEKPLPTEPSKKFSFVIKQATIDNKDVVNLNIVDLYVERWVEGALFTSDIIIDSTKEPSISTKPVNSYSGMYVYEIQGKKFSGKINGVIPE